MVWLAYYFRFTIRPHNSPPSHFRVHPIVLFPCPKLPTAHFRVGANDAFDTLFVPFYFRFTPGSSLFWPNSATEKQRIISVSSVEHKLKRFAIIGRSCLVRFVVSRSFPCH